MSQPDEPVLWRLYLARMALEEGREAAQGGLAFGRMRAVLALDQAAELVLVTLLSKRGQVGDRDQLPALLDKFIELHADLKSHREPVRSAHVFRNRVAHEGRVPSPEDARQIAVAIESFIRAALTTELGIALEEATPAALVEEEAVRSHLLLAEEALRRSEYREAVRQAAVAFASGRLGSAWSVGFDEVRVIGDGLASAVQRALQVALPGGNVKLGDFGKQVYRALLPLVDVIMCLQAGVSLDELRWFRDVTPAVGIFVSGKDHQTVYLKSLPETKEVATHVLDFATRAVLRFEASARVRRERGGS